MFRIKRLQVHQDISAKISACGKAHPSMSQQTEALTTSGPEDACGHASPSNSRILTCASTFGCVKKTETEWDRRWEEGRQEGELERMRLCEKMNCSDSEEKVTLAHKSGWHKMRRGVPRCKRHSMHVRTNLSIPLYSKETSRNTTFER